MKTSIQILDIQSFNTFNIIFPISGIYNKNQTVAIKVFLNQQSMEREVAILQALRAMKEVNIEDRGIPRVYFFGKITGDYNAIAMTLFDESLEKRYELQGKKISDLSILLIFRQAVCTILSLSIHEISNFLQI